MAIMSFLLIYLLILFLSFLPLVIGVMTELPLWCEGTICRSKNVMQRCRYGACLIRLLNIYQNGILFVVLLLVSLSQIFFLNVIMIRIFFCALNGILIRVKPLNSKYYWLLDIKSAVSSSVFCGYILENSLCRCSLYSSHSICFEAWALVGTALIDLTEGPPSANASTE